MSSLPTRELGAALSSVPVRCRPPLTCQPLFGEPTPESSLGGDLLLGFSVFRRAAGMPMAVRGWYMPWCRCRGSADVVRGDVGETFMGVLTVEPFGEYWVDLRYAWCWYGACCGMAVAVENWVAMAGRIEIEVKVGAEVEIEDENEMQRRTSRAGECCYAVRDTVAVIRTERR